MPTPLATLGSYSIGECNYTFFVVPFQYRLSRVREPGAPAGVAYRKRSATRVENRPRADYLTAPTRGLLHDVPPPLGSPVSACCETGWYDGPSGFVIDWHFKEDKNTRKDTHARTAHLPMSLQLVLFDEPRARRGAEAAMPRSPWSECAGCLLLRIECPPELTFADLLDINSNLRLLRYQYEDQKRSLLERGPACRFGCFDVGGPTELALRPKVQDDWEVRLWRALLDQAVVPCNDSELYLVPDLDSYPDNRAFVYSHASIADVPWETERTSRLWTLWHQFLYVESDEAPYRGQLIPWEDDWVRRRTYFRWGASSSDARLYGFSNYSACSLCLPHSFAVAAKHFETIYLDQLLLLLYQRISVFALNREAARITQEWKRHGWKAVRPQVLRLQEAFSQFVNLYWFPVFTTQVQGLEMFAIAKQELDNAELFAELRTELAETRSYMDSSYDEGEAQLARTFAWASALTASVGILVGLLGISLILPTSSGVARWCWPTRGAWWAVATTWFGAVAAISIMTWLIRRAGNERKWSGVAGRRPR